MSKSSKETIILAETPITDSTPHTVGDLAVVCRRLERKLAATRQYLTVVTERSKRLEEAGDYIRKHSNNDWWCEIWDKAKEVKP
jgi:hypothetical protein